MRAEKAEAALEMLQGQPASVSNSPAGGADAGSGDSVMNPEVAAVLKQSGLRQCCELVYRWQLVGGLLSFQEWKRMVSHGSFPSQLDTDSKD